MADENNDLQENNNEQGNQEVGRFVEKDGVRLEVPENFWDKTNNSPDVFNILKSQNDLRAQIGEDNSPKDGVYQINIPKEYQDKLEADPEDPLFKEFCKIAKAKRMTQKEFDDITSHYYKKFYETLSNANDFDSEEYTAQEAQALKDKFGGQLDKVKTRIDNFITNSGITDKDILNELAFMQTSAGGVATLDYLLSLRGEPMPSVNGDSRAGVLSREELMELMKQDGYKNGTDKALIDKVTKGWEELYKGY